MRDGSGFAVTCRLRCSIALSLTDRLAQSIALAVHLEEVDVMGEPVEKSTGQALVTEHRRPFLEWQV